VKNKAGDFLHREEQSVALPLRGSSKRFALPHQALAFAPFEEGGRGDLPLPYAAFARFEFSLTHFTISACLRH